MCRLEEPSVAPLASEECFNEEESTVAIEDPITFNEVDVVDGALEDVLEEVMTEQVKQQLWECVVAALRRFVQWTVERVRAWRT